MEIIEIPRRKDGDGGRQKFGPGFHKRVMPKCAKPVGLLVRNEPAARPVVIGRVRMSGLESGLLQFLANFRRLHGQLTDSHAGGSKHCIGHGRGRRRQPRFADASP